MDKFFYLPSLFELNNENDKSDNNSVISEEIFIPVKALTLLNEDEWQQEYRLIYNSYILDFRGA